MGSATGLMSAIHSNTVVKRDSRRKPHGLRDGRVMVRVNRVPHFIATVPAIVSLRPLEELARCVGSG
jgi:hypothetical protein